MSLAGMEMFKEHNQFCQTSLWWKVRKPVITDFNDTKLRLLMIVLRPVLVEFGDWESYSVG